MEKRNLGYEKKRCEIVSLESGEVNLLEEWDRMTWQFCLSFEICGHEFEVILKNTVV